MICPNCQTLCADSACFCSTCGCALQQPVEIPKPQKGTRWIPALLLLMIAVCGLILFFCTATPASPSQIVSSPECPWFTLDSGVLYFDKSLYSGSSELVVPDQIAGVTVTALGKNCFSGCTELTTVYLPKRLVTIGDGAFSGCTAIRGMFIPASVQAIGKEAFSGCTALESVCIHNTMKAIQSNAFDRCNRLAYLFFLGKQGEWTALYSEFINPYATVFCEDGSFYQGGNVYD